ncbi:MAG: flagellin [Kineosporiaceae bacterium]
MAVTRVTQTSMSNAALRGLQGALGRTQRLQEQLSSGKRVARPGDDPSATGSAMALRSQRRADEQYLRNIDDASGRLALTDDTLVSLSSRIQKIRQLALTAGNEAISSDGMAAISAEMTAIKSDVVDLYNTRWLGRPVFGGTVAGSVAIDAAQNYVGDERPVVSRISRDAVLRIDVPGTTAGADTLPDVIDQLADDVVNNRANLGTDLTALDGELTKVLRALGDVGARASRLDSTKAHVDMERLDFTARISENEDVDLPETIMNLESQKVAYQAALGSAAKVLQVSLLDYLR